jgi:hypothetical protein
MSSHLDAARDAAAYKPASSNSWIVAIQNTFAVLHDLQWRAPWEDAPSAPRQKPGVHPC